LRAVARRGRVKIKELRRAAPVGGTGRLSTIYAQIFAAEGDKVLVAASTLQKDVRGALKNHRQHRGCQGRGPRYRRARQGEGHCQGRLRPFRFHVIHGRVKALAEAAREAGLEF